MSIDKITRFQRHHPYIFYTALAVLATVIILITSITASKPKPETSTVKSRNTFTAQRSYSTEYFVNPTGSDSNPGISKAAPFRSIDKALSLAEAGNIIHLEDGSYAQTISTLKNGVKDKPIVIKGTKKAIIHGTPDQARIVEIMHDYISLEGFTIDGLNGDVEQQESYRDKLIYVIGNTKLDGVTGLRITDMHLQNAGGECVRLRYFAVENEISRSTIKNCGVYDFKFDDGGKNGEGIYIGTAPEQRRDGKNPTDDVDESNKNHIHNNVIDTYGNECVDIKEGSTDNLVEHNTCHNQLDEDSAGLDARGGGNTFRYNTSSNNKGAGIRLGGDTENDGIRNNVYGNILENNDAGAIKILRYPQGKICENVIKYDTERLKEKFDKAEFTKRCR